MKKYFISMLLMAAPAVMFAQFKVDSNGDVCIKRTYTESNASVSVGTNLSAGANTYSQYCQMGLHSQKYDTTEGDDCVGVYGEAEKNSNTASDMSIGVFGYGCGGQTNHNIGVFGTIHPYQYGAGIYGTNEGSPYNGSVSGSYAGYFYGDTYVDGTLTTAAFCNLSDSRLENNVSSLRDVSSDGSALGNLLGLNIISYNLKTPSQLSGGEVKQKDGIAAVRREVESKRRHYGVSAQELQKIYPDLVLEGQDGYLAVNYTELVPILIRSIQELKQELNDVKSANDVALSRGATTDVAAAASSANILYQNTPNPFKEQTTIRFSLADDARDASICIFDMTGKMLKKLPISSGETSVTVNGWELGEGMFLYTLLVNGREIDTKRMIITK